MNIRRRTALGGLGAALIASCTRPASMSPTKRALGLADITVRKELSADYAGTLKQAAAMGYTNFGFRLSDYAPNPREPSPAEKAAMVRDAGMSIGPVRLNPRLTQPELEIEQAAAIGARIIALTAAPVFISGGEIGATTPEAFEAWLPSLVDLNEKCSNAGLILAYHNHWWDHAPIGRSSALDWIAVQTEVSFEVDCAWAWLGGIAPLALVERLGARVVSMHFKDVDPAPGQSMFEQLVVPGLGQLDYAALLPNLDRATNAVGYVEVDNPADGLAAASSAARFLTNVRTSQSG